MTRNRLMYSIIAYKQDQMELEGVMADVDAYSESLTAAKPIVSGAAPPTDEEIEKYFSWGYGGDAGSAIYGAKWMKKEMLSGGNDR